MNEENEFLRRDLDDVRHVLFGVNGDNGLRMRFTKMEIAVNELIESRKAEMKARESERQEDRRWYRGIAASIIIVGVVSAGSWLWNAAKVQATQQVMEQAFKKINIVAQEVAPVATQTDASTR